MAHFAPQQTAQNIVAGTPARYVTGNAVVSSGHGSTVPARGQPAPAAGLPLCLCHLLRASRSASQQAWSSATARLHMPCSWSLVARACRAASVRMRAVPQRSAELGSLSMDQDSLHGGPPMAALALPSEPTALRVSAASAVLARPTSSVLKPKGSRAGGADGKSASTGAGRRELGGDVCQGTNPGNGNPTPLSCGDIANHPPEARHQRGQLLGQQRQSVELREQQQQQQWRGNEGEALTEALLPLLSYRSQTPGRGSEVGTAGEFDSSPSLPIARNGRLSPQSHAAAGTLPPGGRVHSAPASRTRHVDSGGDKRSSSGNAGMLDMIDGGPAAAFAPATSATATAPGAALLRRRSHQQQTGDHDVGCDDARAGTGTAEASAPSEAWPVPSGCGGGGPAAPPWLLTQAVRVELGPDAAFSLASAQATGLSVGAAAVTAEGAAGPRGRAAAPDPWPVRRGTSTTSTSTSRRRAGFSGVLGGANAAAAAAGGPRAAVGLSSPHQRQRRQEARAGPAAGAARKTPTETATAVGRANGEAAVALLSPPPRPHALWPMSAAAQPPGALALVQPAALATTAAVAGQEAGSALLLPRAGQQQRVLTAGLPGAVGFGGGGGREGGGNGGGCQPATAAGAAPLAEGGSVSPQRGGTRLGIASSLTEGGLETRRRQPPKEQQRQPRRRMPYDRSPQGQGERPWPPSTGRRSWPGVSNPTALSGSTAAGPPDLGQPSHQPSASSPLFPRQSNGSSDRPAAAPLPPLHEPRLAQQGDDGAGGSDGVGASSEPVLDADWDSDSDFNYLDRIGEPSTSYDVTALLPLEPPAGWRRRRRLVQLFPVPRPHRRKRRALARAARAAAKAAAAAAAAAEVAGTGTGGARKPSSSSAPAAGPADGEPGGDVSVEFGTPSAAVAMAAAPPYGSRRQRFSFPFTVSRTSDTAIQMLALAPCLTLTDPGAQADPGSSTGGRGQTPCVPVPGGLGGIWDVGEARDDTATVPGSSRGGCVTVGKSAGLRAGVLVPGTGTGGEDPGTPRQNSLAPPLPADVAAAAAVSRAGSAVVERTESVVKHTEAAGASWDDLTAEAEAAPSPAVVLSGAGAALGAAARAVAAAAAAPVQASEPYLQLFTQSYVLYGVAAPEHKYLVYRYGNAGEWSWRPMLPVTGTRSPPLVAVAIPAVPAVPSATAAAAATAASTSSPDHPPDLLPPSPQLQPHATPAAVVAAPWGSPAGTAVRGVPEGGACGQLAASAAAAAGPTSVYGDGAGNAAMKTGSVGAGDTALKPWSVDAGAVAPLQFYLTAEALQPPPARTPPPASATATAARADGAKDGSAAGSKRGGGGGAGTDGGGGWSAGYGERSRPDSARAARGTAPPLAPAAVTAAAAPYDGVVPLELSRPGHYLVGANPLRPDGRPTGSGRRSSSRGGGNRSSGDGSGGGSSKAGSCASAAGRSGAATGQKAPKAALAKAMELRRGGATAATALLLPALLPVVPYDAAAATAASGPLGPAFGGQQAPQPTQAGPVAPSAGRQQQHQGQQQQLHRPAPGEVPTGGRELPAAPTPSGPPALRGQPWAQSILRQELALVLDASSLAGWRDRHWDQSARALRRLWEDSQRVRPGLLVLATSRLLKSLQQLWADKQACLLQPDVLLLGQGTQVAYRLAPGERGAGPDGGGGWQQDEEWAAVLDQSYDAAAVRQAVADVVRECSSLRVVGGGGQPRGPSAPALAAASTSSAGSDPAATHSNDDDDEEEEEEEEEQLHDDGDLAEEGDVSGFALSYTASGRPTVSYGLAKQQGRHQVCLMVHRSLLGLVTRRIEDRLRQPRPQPQTGPTGRAPSPSAAAAAGRSSAGPQASAPAGDRPSSTATQAEGTSAELRDGHPGHPCSSPSATPGPGSVASPGPIPSSIRFVTQPRGPRGEWASLYVLPAAAGKAAALRHVLSRFGIDPRVVVAVGDTDRDAELLAEAAAAVVTAPRPPPALRELLRRGRAGAREGIQSGQRGEDGSRRGLQSLGPAAVDAGTEAGGGGGGGRHVAVQSSVSGPAGVMEGLRMLGLL